MSVMDFCFQNADTKGRDLDYVLWLDMVMSAVMLLSRIYLLPEKSLSISTKVCRVCVKKILKEFSAFYNIVLYFMIGYSCHEVSLLHPVFSIFYLPTFMYK